MRAATSSTSGAARFRRARAASSAAPTSAASGACVLLASGLATFLTSPAMSRQLSLLCMGALTLTAMMTIPLLIARTSGQPTLLAMAATLNATTTGMNAVPTYLKQDPHGNELAALMIATAVGLLICCKQATRMNAKRIGHSRHAQHARTGKNKRFTALHATCATALLALLAGLSSGTQARFQLTALCGQGAAQPLWQTALSIMAVCTLAVIADRTRGNSTLIALYVTRAGANALCAATLTRNGRDEQTNHNTANLPANTKCATGSMTASSLKVKP